MNGKIENAEESERRITSSYVRNNGRKNELLEKLEKKEINYDECVKLCKMFKKEIDEATEKNDILTVILTAGELIYVGIVLSELSKKGFSSQT